MKKETGLQTNLMLVKEEDSLVGKPRIIYDDVKCCICGSDKIRSKWEEYRIDERIYNSVFHNLISYINIGVIL